MIPNEAMAQAWAEAVLRAHTDAKKRWCHKCLVASTEPECWMCQSVDHLKHFEPKDSQRWDQGKTEELSYRARRGRHEVPDQAQSA